jgi:hypothetical protein
MRDFSKLLAKGNFTPKERVLLLIADVVSKDRGEKGFLSQADIYALSEGWTPTNNDEVREYNRYNQGWKYACYAELDAQTHYLQTKVAYQTMQMMLRDFAYNPVYSEVKQALDGLAKIKRVEAKEAIEIINKQRQEKLKQGFYFETAIYELALELIDEEAKKKLLALCDDDNQEYLEQEQELAELYKQKDFEGIAERVAERGFNHYINKYQLFHYYACIPILEIAKRYAKENNLPFDETTKEELKKKAKGELDAIDRLTQTLEQHAKEKQTTIEEIIKTTCLKWINEGLLENDYTPLIIAEPELLTKWLETKEKARLTLQSLIEKGTLKTGKDEDADEIITGESLYNCGLDYAFVKDFKQDADEYHPERGLVIGDDGERIDSELLITQEKFFSRYKMHLERARDLLEPLSILQEKEENGEIVVDIKDDTKSEVIDKGGLKKMFLTLRNNFVNKYEILLAFEDLFKRLSKVYEMDLTYKVSLWITECGELVDSFNNTLLDALKVELPYSPQAGKKKHYKDNELFIDKDKIKPSPITVELYVNELTKLLGDNF